MKEELSDLYVNIETGRLRAKLVNKYFTGPVTGMYGTLSMDGKIHEEGIYFITTSGKIMKGK